jgi:hypothetical protein
MAKTRRGTVWQVTDLRATGCILFKRWKVFCVNARARNQGPRSSEEAKVQSRASEAGRTFFAKTGRERRNLRVRGEMWGYLIVYRFLSFLTIHDETICELK